MLQQQDVSRSRGLHAVAQSVWQFGVLLVAGRIHQPRANIDAVAAIPDGTHGRVYRETTVDGPPAAEPVVLVVEFRLRGVHGWGHRLFRWESLFNTPMFVGFPGFVSKLWLAHDERERYRGIYDWDGARSADFYAKSLSWVLVLVCVPGSISYEIVEGRKRNDWIELPHD
ncbi:hypothetical protein OG921_24515 [Aldersonia sp. NBC_00410]|uniref:hypothetical protein n=1 Tax=Aldersonia sp. NBC_00410 TaxID=2975954 RepID=UPI00225064DE|nr:hypothetical protein [Aldersonia sp. NBC_00410]MCX5046341.1 hypothetical protein [Aldersonia sp. NBC_00410]